MAEFLSKENLLDELLNLFKDAEKFLVLVSPYIKLNDEMKRALQRKIHDEKFVIRIVFGKNEENKSRSLSESDMEFFKKFNNVEIYYNQDLHAKYYANEYASIVTSLNLHQYSVKNNIEIGILYDIACLICQKKVGWILKCLIISILLLKNLIRC